VPGSLPDDDLSNFPPLDPNEEKMTHFNIDEWVADRESIEAVFELWMSTR